MVATSLATTVLKPWLGRTAPAWQDTLGFYESRAFPSGHASSIAAFAGIVIVLVVDAWYAGPACAGWSTCGRGACRLLVALDRVLLGRHYPTDVIAGTLLGVGFVLLGLAVYRPAAAQPLPRRPSRSPRCWPPSASWR